MTELQPEDKLVSLNKAKNMLIEKYNSQEVQEMDKVKRFYFRKGIAASLELLDELAYNK